MLCLLLYSSRRSKLALLYFITELAAAAVRPIVLWQLCRKSCFKLDAFEN